MPCLPPRRFPCLNGVILGGKPYIFGPKVQADRRKQSRRTGISACECAGKRRQDAPQGREIQGKTMGRLIKVVFVLAILGFAALVGYAYLGVQTPPQNEVTKPVVLDAN